MHKRMLAVSGKLERYECENPEKRALADNARDRLYAGQCNCPYWHGVFGGVYLPHIRQAVTSALIEADTRLDELLDRTGLHFSTRDFTLDGYDDVLVETDSFTALFSPRYGATLMDLSLRRHGLSLTDTLTRRREGYHLKVDVAVVGQGRRRSETAHDRIRAKEPGLARLLTDDWYLKRCFITHFFTEDVDFERFAGNRFGEEGDFIIEQFDHQTDAVSGEATFTRNGNLWRPDGVIPMRVRKRFSFSPAGEEIRVVHELVCPAGHEVRVNFGIENNFNLLAGHAEDRYVVVDGSRQSPTYLDSAAVHHGAGSYGLIDEFRGLGLALVSEQTSSELWRLPIWTVSQSDGGFERVFQGTTLVSLYRLTVGGKPVSIEQRLYAGDIRLINSATRTASRSVES
jgi:alpha-amylase